MEKEKYKKKQIICSKKAVIFTIILFVIPTILLYGPIFEYFNAIIEYKSGFFVFFSKMFSRRSNLLDLYLLPLFLVTIYFHRKYYCKEKEIFFYIVSLIVLSFIISNVKIMINGRFWGFDEMWDNGDLINYGILSGYAKANLYQTNYPPLAVLIYKFIYLFIRNAQEPEYAFNYIIFLCDLIICLSVYFLSYSIIKEKPYAKLIAISMMFTSPMLYAMGRKNVILFAFVFTLIFVKFYDSENVWLRRVALVSIAVAANIKIYPVVFMWIYIRKKRYKDFLFGVCITVLIFLIPSFFYGGIEKCINDYANGIKGFVQVMTNSGYTTVSIRSIVWRTFGYCGIGMEKWGEYKIASELIFDIYIICTGIVLFVSKNDFVTLTMLSLLCVFVPDFSPEYIRIFLIIPFLYFLKDEIEKNNMIYRIILAIFLLLFIELYDNTFVSCDEFLRIIGLLGVVSYLALKEFKTKI